MSDSDLEIRRAREEDAESLAPLWKSAFNLPLRWLESFPERFRPERVLVAVEGTRVVSTAATNHTNQWFGGRPIPMAGVASVATDPMYRGTGAGPRVLRRLLEEAREEGYPLAGLYPSTVPFYRRQGFEFGGIYTVYRLSLDDLPAGRAGWTGETAELVAMPEDQEPIRESFRRLAARENGVVEGLDDDWWSLRVLGRHSEAEPGGTVCTPEDVPDGYAAYHQESLGETVSEGYRLACTHLVAHSRRAALALLGFFRRFRGVGRELTWQGPPTEPLAFLVPEQRIRFVRSWRLMTRILDVTSAFEARGYPEVDGEAEFGVEDPLFAENRGTFRVETSGGKCRVTKIEDEPRAPLSIGALSALFTSYVTPATAAGMGLVPSEHPAHGLFARLFAGPAPWTPDFF